MRKIILTTAVILCGILYASHLVAADRVNWGGNAPNTDFFKNEIENYKPFSDQNSNEFIGDVAYPSDYHGGNTVMYAPGDLSGGTCYIDPDPLNPSSMPLVVPCADGSHGCITATWDDDEDCDGLGTLDDGCPNLWGPVANNGCPPALPPDPNDPNNCNNCPGVPVGSGIMVLLFGLGTYGLSIVRRNRKNQNGVKNN
jgi:hypothetical protein